MRVVIRVRVGGVGSLELLRCRKRKGGIQLEFEVRADGRGREGEMRGGDRVGL